MLNVIDKWLTWTQMKARPSKWQAIVLRSHSSAVNRMYDPHLTIGGTLIPFPNQQPVKFLGVPLSATLLDANHRSALAKTESMMKIDDAPLSG